MLAWAGYLGPSDDDEEVDVFIDDDEEVDDVDDDFMEELLFDEVDEVEEVDELTLTEVIFGFLFPVLVPGLTWLPSLLLRFICDCSVLEEWMNEHVQSNC